MKIKFNVYAIIKLMEQSPIYTAGAKPTAPKKSRKSPSVPPEKVHNFVRKYGLEIFVLGIIMAIIFIVAAVFVFIGSFFAFADPNGYVGFFTLLYGVPFLLFAAINIGMAFLCIIKGKKMRELTIMQASLGRTTTLITVYFSILAFISFFVLLVIFNMYRPNPIPVSIFLIILIYSIYILARTGRLKTHYLSSYRHVTRF